MVDVDSISVSDGVSLSDEGPFFQQDIAESSFNDQIAHLLFTAASHLTDPLCFAHEYWRRTFVIKDEAPQLHPATQVAKKVLLYAGIYGWGHVAVFTTAPAFLLRFIAKQLQSKPFSTQHMQTESKVLPESGAFTIFSWNICAPGGGYAISDGGVAPWRDRLDAVVDKILEQKADINCLFEVFDIKAATYIAGRLREHGYTHIFYNMGPRVVGVSSGIFVASKYAVENAEFDAFPEESLIGRTKYAAKGVFSFDIVSNGRSLARLFATHLQHSELPEYPTPEEIAARAYQLQFISQKIEAVRDRCAILTGDLNFDPTIEQQEIWRQFHAGEILNPSPSWAGDGYCADMVGKQPSGELDLDHTVVRAGDAVRLVTELVPVGYDPTTYNADALSDHAGKLSTITLLA